MKRKDALIVGLGILAQWLLVAAAVIALIGDRPGAASIYLVLFATVSIIHNVKPLKRQARTEAKG
ncbi:hypothetical protein O4160_20730 [Rhodococcus sp. IEGM 1401]|uniref:hypothetical protein n=1 Tax=unclassified Rhodococcus (in: high G+C Gram-positive bacteria) TaxID=192944 RepID=UPI0022B4BE1C|nr:MULTISPECIES: hypothetical protein [unclassified Rhodococcus (in: high G+C Gram-positive bacteria)]MCZ4563274.1 hypothetical protein [Rhodococcus sp. IEGM 1401]MDI9923439.1 hypothetical protein [Rhodococcus sp. IEGM 1372]MDV8035929.1 hypothetical protein [Rhodococcus sp. IEGM 1414]